MYICMSYEGCTCDLFQFSCCFRNTAFGYAPCVLAAVGPTV